MKRILPVTAALLILAACSSAPPEAAKKPEPKVVEPVSARKAFYLIYPAARIWAPDVQPARVESMPVDGITPKDGKYGAWRVTFVSQTKGKAKVFTYSVIEASASLHEGVFAVGEEGFSGNPRPFYVQAFKIDSDAALKTAEGKSVEYLKKNPTKPVFMQLEFTKLYPETAWRVLWGDSVSTSDHSIYVSSATSEYLGKS